MTTRTKRILLFAVVAAFSLAFDQGSKVWARRALKGLSPNGMTVIPNWWDFRYSENMGSVFGLFRQHAFAPILLTILGVGILALVLYQFLREETTVATTFGYGFVVGGAIGNLIDRIAFGRVTDFIVWYFVSINPQGVSERHEWYTFNVADAALVVGLVLLAPMMLRPKSAGKNPHSNAVIISSIE